MAKSSFPFEGQTTTESQYSRLFQALAMTGVVRKADSTLRVDAPAGGGLNVDVNSGDAIVQGFMFSSTAVETVPIDPPGASKRIDALVLRLDPVSNIIDLAVVKAAKDPSSGVVTLTQVNIGGIFEFPLAFITVKPGVATFTAADIEDARVYTDTGTRMWTDDSFRPTTLMGLVGYNRSRDRLEYRAGSSWVQVPVEPTDTGWKDITLLTGFAAASPQPPQARKINNRVFTRGGVVKTSPPWGTPYIEWGTLPQAVMRPAARVTLAAGVKGSSVACSGMVRAVPDTSRLSACMTGSDAAQDTIFLDGISWLVD